MVVEEGWRLATFVPAALETMCGFPFAFGLPVSCGCKEGKKECGKLAGSLGSSKVGKKECGSFPDPAGGWVLGEVGGWLVTLVPAGLRKTKGFIVGEV